jgi:G:T/U-mismatch repair DNA glycosylase
LETSIVEHRLSGHRICPRTETLIIGTFNPDTPRNKAEFFYSTGRNYLWRLLPVAFGEKSLQQSNVADKIEFIRAKRIDFIDLIASVEVKSGREGVRNDVYLGSKVRSWTDVIREIDRLSELRRVCFTRKTFHKIPEIKSRIAAVSEKLRERTIELKYIVSPARYYSRDKQKEWTEFLASD